VVCHRANLHSLHTIGVILLKQKKLRIFEQFLNDVLPNATIISLPKVKYSEIISISSKYKMDFDDSFQALVALEFELVIKTMDRTLLKFQGNTGRNILNPHGHY
jgi:hypothetical protein